MAFKMAEGSLFAILSRSAWWYSVLIGLFIIAVSVLLLTGQFAIIASSLSLPFFGIAGFAAYKQSKLPSQKRVMEVAELARGMSAAEIAATIAVSYTDLRFDSEKFKGNAADLALLRGNRRLLLCSKRFKAATTGIEPLKQLVAAGEKIDATGFLYVALGDFSDSARKYATENDIELIQAPRLAAYFDNQVMID